MTNDMKELAERTRAMSRIIHPIELETLLNDMGRETHCPHCDWNSIAERGIEAGHCKVVDGQDTQTDFGPGVEFEVECHCPRCGTIFNYFDGSP